MTILPQKNIVQKVGGERVKLNVLIPPGQSPETYSLLPAQMGQLQRADIYFQAGLLFEQSILSRLKDSNLKLKVCDMSSGIKEYEISNGDNHGHFHGEMDPHIWMDPENAGVMAENIKLSLGQSDPEGKEFYAQNCRYFKKELALLDKKISKKLSPFKGRSFYVFHPAFGYFASAYGLKQVAIQSGGKSPSPRHIAGIIKKARRDSIKTIFVQPQFSSKSALTVASSLGGKVVYIDPLAEDYMNNLLTIAEKIAESFK